MASAVKRVLVGKPIATSAEGTQRLTKLLALAVFSSDAVSSTAYATEEILDVLIPEAGLARAIDTLVPISLVVVVLLVLVVFSYHQTIRAYPRRGRLVHRVAREPRREPVARRGRRAHGRLHPDRRGVGLGRRRRGDLGVPITVASHRVALPRRDRRAHTRQPAWSPGVGAYLRRADVPLHRRACRAHRARSRAIVHR